MISAKAPFLYEDGNMVRYTAAKRRKESKAKKRIQILILENKRYGSKEKESALYSVNLKSVDYELFKLYLIGKDKLNRENWFYQRELWLKMNFRSFCYRRKAWINLSIESKPIMVVMS